MSQSVSFSQFIGEREFGFAVFQCLILLTLCNALFLVEDSMSDANGQEPRQFPHETGADFAKRLRLLAKIIEEREGRPTLDSNNLRMKAAIVESQWLFAEQFRLIGQPPASRQG